MEEVWRNIPNYEGIYEVSNRGKIRVLPRIRLGFSYKTNKKTWRHYKGKLLKPSFMGNYLCVVLTKGGLKRTMAIHRAVALAFLPNPENKLNINHIDFNTSNNKVENIEWCTQFENIHHTINNHRSKYAEGENAGHSKFTNIQIPEIKRMKLSGYSQRIIAEYYDVNQSTICRIINNNTYKNAPEVR